MTQHLFQNRTRLNLDKLWNGIWCLSLVTTLSAFLFWPLMISEVPVTRVSYLVLVFRPCDRYSNQYHHAFRWYNNKFDKPSCAIIILLINTCCILIGRTDTEVEVPILWPPNANSWLLGKDPDAGKDWRQKEKGMTEDKMAGWHHWFNGHELGQTGRWWETERPGVLQSMGSQRVGHDLETEQQQY